MVQRIARQVSDQQQEDLRHHHSNSRRSSFSLPTEFYFRNSRQTDRFSGSPEAASSPSAPSSRRASGRRGPRVGDPRFNLPDSFDAEGRPLWKRPSDGRHVYVMCPVETCGRIDHKSIHGFLTHVRRSHPINSILLGPGQMNAIEECAVLPERLGRLPNHGAVSDQASSAGREDAAGLSVQDDNEELQIKEEPVEETGEGVEQELDSDEVEAELRNKLWFGTFSGSQASIDSDTVNQHGKRGRSGSSDQKPSKRLQRGLLFPKRILRRY
jgi:hypothetical protein